MKPEGGHRQADLLTRLVRDPCYGLSADLSAIVSVANEAGRRAPASRSLDPTRTRPVLRLVCGLVRHSERSERRRKPARALDRLGPSNDRWQRKPVESTPCGNARNGDPAIGFAPGGCSRWPGSTGKSRRIRPRSGQTFRCRSSWEQAQPLSIRDPPPMRRESFRMPSASS